MPIQSASSARVQDVVLTRVIHGYRQQQFIGPMFLPIVPVTTRTGRVVQFGKEIFNVYNTRRAPGDTIKRFQTQYSNSQYELVQDAIAAEVPVEIYEEANNGQARINLRNRSARSAMGSVMLNMEIECAKVIQDSSSYETANTVTLSGTDRWDDYSNSNPSVAVRNWKEAVRDQIGVEPTRLGMSAKVFHKLAEHPLIKDKLKYTSKESLTPAMLAALWEFSGGVYIGKGKKLGTDGVTLSDIWSKNVWLAYVPEDAPTETGTVPASGMAKETPSFGYIYQLENYPMAEPEKYDDDKRVYFYTVVNEHIPKLTGLGGTGKVGAGFLATTVIS